MYASPKVSVRLILKLKIVKGVVQITPRFETVFVLACHYDATSKLCQKACAITMGPDTCPHVSTFTGFDHGHHSAAAGSVLPHQRLRQPDSALQALLLACRHWICGKRASGHRGRSRIERLAPTCRTERARCGQTVAGHPAVSTWRLLDQWEVCLRGHV